MKQVVEKHPLAIRWFHWINFPLLAIMIWSGLLIYWANDIYSVKLFGFTLLHFFSDDFFAALNLSSRLVEGMAFHFVFMWLFMLNGLAYVLYVIISGEWKKVKYNPIQRMAYLTIIIMGMGSVATGIAIYKPIQFGWLCWLCGGYASARFIHFFLTIGYCLFFLVHVVQVIRAGWRNFNAMITGCETINNE